MDSAWPCILVSFGLWTFSPSYPHITWEGARISGRGLIPCVIFLIFITIIIIFVCFFFVFFFFLRRMDFRSLGRILVCDCQPKGGLPIVLQVRGRYGVKYLSYQVCDSLIVM